MALTVQQAQQAGQIAAQIGTIGQIVTDLQAAMSANASIYSMRASIVGGGDLFANINLSAGDTAIIFSAILGVAQTNLKALDAQLAALGS